MYMSIMTQAFGFVLVSLIVINGLLGGGVVDAIGTFATDEEKSEARADIICGTGYLLWTPVTNFYGIDIPTISYSNVIVAALVALSLILILRITTGIKWKFMYSIYIFIAAWVGIKLLGFVLLQVSGPECILWAESTVEQTSGFYDVAAAGGALYGLKMVWGMRK